MCWDRIVEAEQAAKPQAQEKPSDDNPAIAPWPSAVGGMVEQQQIGGRDVASIGAGLSVPRVLPVRLHTPAILKEPKALSQPEAASVQGRSLEKAGMEVSA